MKNLKNTQFKKLNNQKLMTVQKLERGIVLLEALIAILIFSFGVLGIVGLQAAMVKGTTQAKNRSDASFIAQRRIAMIWADPDPATLIAFGEVNTAVIELPSGLRSTNVTVVGNNADVVVTVQWTVPGEPQHSYSTNAYIYGAAS